jgi:hypothetical protein
MPSRTPNGVPVDTDLYVDFGMSLDNVDLLINLARTSGYTCDSVTGAKPFLFERGFELRCNRYTYTYYFRDKGRGWYVSTE